MTDEKQTNAYPVASLEATTLPNEKLYYSIPDAARTDKSTIPQYPADTYTNPNQWIQKVKGDATKIGTGIVLKVMAGDKVNIRANSWWTNNSVPASSANTVSPLMDIVNALISGVPNVQGSKIVSGQLNSTILNPSITDLLNNRNTNNYVSSKPKAYLNWILLDEQFKQVLTNDGKNSGFEQAGAENEFKTHTKSGIELTKNGYLYVYVSNESTDINVFFDNLQVTHIRGPLVEETHYYPFGLTMAGISSKAAGSLENKRKFNKGSELQNKEFSDGSGLELYATNFRSLDPQLGRWWQIDPKPGYAQSLYSAMGNNPILYNDPLGDTLRVQYRTGFLGLGGKREVIYNNGALSNTDGSAYTGKVKCFLKQTVNGLNSGRTGSTEAAGMIGELQGSKNNFTIVKGTENKFDVNPSQRTAGFANQLRTDPNLSPSLAATPAAAMQGGAGGTITWNPSGANVWVVGGTQDNNPTTNLMHELFHGRDANRGLLDNRLDNGLKRDEWQASYKENIVRQQMGLSLREYYRSQDNAGTITPLPPRLLDASNNPILPAWVPGGW